MFNKRDIRFLPLYAVAGLLLFYQDSYKILGWVAGIGVSLGIVSHILRRVFWPYIDLAQYAKKALENPVASAIVFASVVFFLTESFTATVSLFK